MTKILILDDHPLYREGVVSALTSNAMRAAVLGASSIADALQLLDDDPTIDLVLVDRKLRGEDGMEALKRIGAQHPTVARVLISGDESDESVNAAMRVGAQGFLPKSLSIRAMLAAIQRILEGDVFWPGQLEGASVSVPHDLFALTVRQLDVLRLLGKGSSNAEIATELQIGERTVKAHLKGIYETLGVDTRMRALLKAKDLGLIR
jgi:DNA-binding NarL/FixJ family response regulator